MTAPKGKTTRGRTTPKGTVAKRAPSTRKATGRTASAAEVAAQTPRPTPNGPDPSTLAECDREIAVRQQALAAMEQQRTRVIAELNYLSGVRATGIRLGVWSEP